jgi:protein-L-isoaspartate(D-aspartate) O-methyltransferase
MPYHVGAGVGYYTAILARLVGRRGRVTAIEFDPGLAERLAANFAGARNVRVVHGDGSRIAFDAADVILVNAGATRLADRWLDGLSEAGRFFALSATATRFWRRGFRPWGFFPCEGMRDPASEAALAAAFGKDDGRRVQRLYRRGDVSEEQCWLRAPDWCLAYE